MTWGAIGILAAGVVLAVAGGTSFDLSGPACDTIVGPTCGLTRATTALVAGDVGKAWAYNPASFLVGAGVLGGLIRATRGWLTHRWIAVSMRPTKLGWGLIAAAVLVLWINQYTNADLIQGGWT